MAPIRLIAVGRPQVCRGRPSMCWLVVSFVLCSVMTARAAYSQALDIPAGAVRFATFNVAFSNDQPGAMHDALRTGNDRAMQQVAEIIQIVRPHVLLINEFDYDAEGEGPRLFREHYLARGQNGRQPVEYPHDYFQPTNTGELSGVDLNGDGRIALPDDAFGFGRHPGHYGMLVLSQFAIDRQGTRTFQKFRWRDMPDALWPIDPRTGQAYYADDVRRVFRLSSKSHWDVHLRIKGRTVHWLVSHPTPPVFDGPEDRNGARNHDEIRFWADYLGGRGAYIYDDQGRDGGLSDEALFVLAGDMNADPVDGDSRARAILQLLDHPRIHDPMPRSIGGRQQSDRQGGINLRHRGDPAFDTGDFNDRLPGNLRIDYVLPCRELAVVGAGVFWPAEDHPDFQLVSASDHRLVWVDVAMPE